VTRRKSRAVPPLSLLLRGLLQPTTGADAPESGRAGAPSPRPTPLRSRCCPAHSASRQERGGDRHWKRCSHLGVTPRVWRPHAARGLSLGLRGPCPLRRLGPDSAVVVVFLLSTDRACLSAPKRSGCMTIGCPCSRVVGAANRAASPPLRRRRSGGLRSIGGPSWPMPRLRYVPVRKVTLARAEYAVSLP
jgi:hypothetical protein